MTQDNQEHISGEALKISGSGYIHYKISKGDQGLFLKITDNDDGGTFTSDPVYLWKLIDCIAAVESQCFRTDDLRDVIPGNNVNDPAFVLAVLKDIGLVEEVGDNHRLRRRSGLAPR